VHKGSSLLSVADYGTVAFKFCKSGYYFGRSIKANARLGVSQASDNRRLLSVEV
jgi:hypothetical protein